MIQTQDQLTAAMAGQRIAPIFKSTGPVAGTGNFYTRWQNAGFPGAGVVPSAGLNGEQVTSAFAGAVPFQNASGGKRKYLSGFEAQASVAGLQMLYDRLWQNSGVVVTTTTAQVIAPVALPPRDANGAANGVGVEAWLDIYTALGNGTAITTAVISYTNSDGVAGRAGIVQSIPANAVAGTVVPITMQSGDAGVQSVQSITLGASLVSGSVGLVLRRRLASINISVVNQGDFRGFFDVGQPLYDGTAMEFMSIATSAAGVALFGAVSTIEG